MDAFVGAAVQLRPRYAISFASGICHLHREVRDENRFWPPPPQIKTYFEANAARTAGNRTRRDAGRQQLVAWNRVSS